MDEGCYPPRQPLLGIHLPVGSGEWLSLHNFFPFFPSPVKLSLWLAMSFLAFAHVLSPIVLAAGEVGSEWNCMELVCWAGSTHHNAVQRNWEKKQWAGNRIGLAGVWYALCWLFFLYETESDMDDHLMWVRQKAHHSSLNADMKVITRGTESTWGFFWVLSCDPAQSMVLLALVTPGSHPGRDVLPVHMSKNLFLFCEVMDDK